MLDQGGCGYNNFEYVSVENVCVTCATMGCIRNVVKEVPSFPGYRSINGHGA